MTQTALVLGASGKVGRHFARAFETSGWTVRRFIRGTDMAAAARGADIIVNGLNPPAYHDWDRILPAITSEVLASARASGATVLLPGNVYVYGDTPGTWDETTPHRPVARKGRIRAELEASYRAAAEGGVRTIVLRAGDFMDPEGGGSVMDMVYLRALKRGQIVAPGPADAVHAHAYLPDLARAGVALSEMRAELPAFADIPFPGHAFTAEELRRTVERLTGRPMRLAGFPWWLMRLAAPVWELAREMGEMRYLWETPHRLGGDRLAALLPEFRPTPFEEAVAACLPPATRRDRAETGSKLARVGA